VNAAWSRCIVVAAIFCSAKLAIADFVLITEDEARRPRQFIRERSGQMPPPRIAVFGPKEDAPTDLPLSFVVKFSARGGAMVNMDSVVVTYMVRDPVDLTGRIRPFIQKEEIRIKDAIVPPGKHQLRISVEDSNGESRHTLYTFCIRTCAIPNAGNSAPLR
jgi:hypothetical protein